MEISIVVCLGDRNGNNFQKLYDNIVAVMKDNFELVVVDNRTNRSVSIDFTQRFITYVSNDTNTRQLHGRMLGFKASHGDYIWFIDDDDEIVARPPVIKDMDMAVLQAHIKDFNDPDNKKGFNWYTIDIHAPLVYHKYLIFDLNDLDSKMVGVLLWRKLIRRSILEDAYNTLCSAGDITGISHNEDVIITRMFTYNNRYLSIYFYNAIYYNYDISSSTCSINAKVDSSNKIEPALVGYDKGWRILYALIPSDEVHYRRQADLWFRLCMLISWRTTDTIRLDCFNLLKRYTHKSSLDDMLSIYKHNFIDNLFGVPVNKIIKGMQWLSKAENKPKSKYEVIYMLTGGKYAEHSETDGNIL